MADEHPGQADRADDGTDGQPGDVEAAQPRRGADKSGPTLYLIIGVLVIFYGGYSAVQGKGSWGNVFLMGVGVVIAAAGLYLRMKAKKQERESGPS